MTVSLYFFIVLLSFCEAMSMEFYEFTDNRVELERQKQWMPYLHAYPWTLPDCSFNTNIQDERSDFTIVTALVDINRSEWSRFRRPFEYYLAYAIPLLNMNIPLVTLVDHRVVDFVKFFRREKMHMTKIIPIAIDDLEYFTHLDKIRDIMESADFQRNHHFLHHPEGFSAEYNLVVNSKVPLLHEVSKLDPFNTTYFYWLDFGYGHMDDIYPKNCSWTPKNIMIDNDKLTYIMINNVSYLSSVFDIYKEDLPPFFGGGFFGGNKRAVGRYYDLHKEVFKILVEHSMIDDDQTLAIACYFQDPDLFNLVKGWWHDAFKLFF